MGLGGSTELHGFNNFPPEVSLGLDGDTYVASCVGTLIISSVDTCIVSRVDVGFQERVATLVTSLVSMSIPSKASSSTLACRWGDSFSFTSCFSVNLLHLWIRSKLWLVLQLGGSTALWYPCSQESCHQHRRGLRTSGQTWPSWPCTGRR